MTVTHASSIGSSLIGLRFHNLITLQCFERNFIISKKIMAK